MSTEFTKKDLIEAYVKEGFVDSKVKAKNIIEFTFDHFTSILKKKGTVSISKYGKFVTVRRKARNGINPATQEPIKIPAKTVVKFKPSQALKDAVE